MKDENNVNNLSFLEPTSLSSLAISIVTLAISKGITIDELAEAIDLSLIDFINPNAHIPDQVLLELMQMLMHRLPDVPISLELARSSSMATLGGLAQGIQYAPDVETALTWWTRNHWFMADQLVSHIEQTPSEFALVAAHPHDTETHGLTTEAGMGTHWLLLNAITDLEIPLIRVELVCEKSVLLQTYEAFFRAPVAFQSGRNALVFSRERLKVPTRLGNPQMFELVEHQFSTLRQQQSCDRAPLPLATLRQSIIENADEGEYGATAAAAAANLGLRSAQRLAAQCNTSLQQLIDEVRLANAKRFLSNPEISIEKVSQLVGYADARAFRRAFKRWTSLTPTTYRKLLM